jgi:hypothetical protein
MHFIIGFLYKKYLSWKKSSVLHFSRVYMDTKLQYYLPYAVQALTSRTETSAPIGKAVELSYLYTETVNTRQKQTRVTVPGYRSRGAEFESWALPDFL